MLYGNIVNYITKVMWSNSLGCQGILHNYSAGRISFQRLGFAGIKLLGWQKSLKHCIIAPIQLYDLHAMDFSRLIESLTPDMIERFTQAVETGKWPDGTSLSEQQKETCIQALMIYRAKNTHDDDEPFTVTSRGDLVSGKKTREAFQGESANDKANVVIDPSLIIPGTNKH